jgi:hypothetical protein
MEAVSGVSHYTSKLLDPEDIKKVEETAELATA